MDKYAITTAQLARLFELVDGPDVDAVHAHLRDEIGIPDEHHAAMLGELAGGRPLLEKGLNLHKALVESLQELGLTPEEIELLIPSDKQENRIVWKADGEAQTTVNVSLKVKDEDGNVKLANSFGHAERH